MEFFATDLDRLGFLLETDAALGLHLEYVVAHELCNLLHRDHSAAFWRTLETVIPDCPAAQESDGGGTAT